MCIGIAVQDTGLPVPTHMTSYQGNFRDVSRPLGHRSYTKASRIRTVAYPLRRHSQILVCYGYFKRTTKSIGWGSACSRDISPVSCRNEKQASLTTIWTKKPSSVVSKEAEYLAVRIRTHFEKENILRSFLFFPALRMHRDLSLKYKLNLVIS